MMLILIEMDDTLTGRLKALALEQGIDLVGVAHASAFTDAPRGHRPESLLRRARSVFVMAIHVPDASFELAPSREYSAAYLVANSELNRVAFRVARFLESEGHRALQVPASPPYDYERNMGDLSHRHAGQLAGIGVFGKSDLLLSERFGPRMRLVSVVTDALLEADEPLEIDLCKDCEECIRGCPSKALQGPHRVDKQVCDGYHVEAGRKLQLEDGEQICGVCIRLCPVGRVI
jgi:epoxyqueuosine reductase QueG